MLASIRRPFSIIPSCFILLSCMVVVSSEESFFEFSSGAKEYDDAYKLAMAEVEQNIEKASLLLAQAGNNCGLEILLMQWN